MDSVFDYERMRHTPGFAEYERSTVDRIENERTSVMAAASLILSALWLIGAASFVAIVCGHIALHQMREDPHLRGKTMARVSLALGYSGLVAGVILFSTNVMADPAFVPGTGIYPPVKT